MEFEATFARISMKRIAYILTGFLFASAPLAAQEPVVQAPEVAIEALNSDLRSFLTLHTPDALLLFKPRALSVWLEEELKRTHASMAATEKSMFRRASQFFTGILIPVASDELAVERPAPSRRVPGRLDNVPDTVSYLPLPLPGRDTVSKDVLPGVLSEYADLGIQVHGDGQLGGSWSQYRPCDAAANRQCEASLFPQLRPDMTFGVRVAGRVADRINVNVNFDQKNEFDAENNLNVSYQGLRDEILQRIDVGDVSIALPVSRYMTRGIPSGNFGLRATAQVGPLELQTVVAQQKGDLARRQFTIAGAGSSQSVAQQQSIVIDDANYVQGQFFYLVDPQRITAYPYIDAIALSAGDAPNAIRPRTGGVIELYRDERVIVTAGGVGNAELGRFLADAQPIGGGLKHSGTFRRLTPGVDYVVHASGLWVTLKSPLRTDEALAMAYVTEQGDTVGDLNAEQSPPGTTPLLRLLRGPVAMHQPGSGTWLYEMHNVYRLDSSAGVELNSIVMSISLGDRTGGQTFQTVRAEQLPYLKFFGLDEDSPTDRIDEAQIYQPSRGTFGDASTTIPGTFIILPAVQPFLDPAAVPSRNLSAAELKAALGTNANSAIYNVVDPVNRAAAARFKLNFDYRVTSDGLASSFNLGAFGIREGSERITLGSLKLERGVDYEIDYDVGQLTLRDPATLFATHPGAELGAAWEQKPLFQIAPTTVFGMNAKYSLGRRGQLDFVGLYQGEKSLMSRPQLGTEPGSIFLGGVSGSLDLGGAFLDRVFGALPGIRLGNPSAATLTAEVAMSSPNPNTQGDAYVDDFETTDELRIESRRQNWVLGSRPETTTGDQNTLPFTTDVSTAAPLIWTHDFLSATGQLGGAFKASEFLDDSIFVVGNEAPEYGLYLNFGGGSTGGADLRRWRSITTSLSPTGTDMSRSEYLEFYAASSTVDPLTLIFDIGTVSEDAFYVDSLGRTTGTYPDGTPWGLGRLDEEARLADREVWGPDKDARGLWDQACVTKPTTSYQITDPRLNCTRGNGIRNSEDLDGNGVLTQSDGSYFRYTVRLDQLSEYLVRDRTQTGTNYQLYRIPLRSGTSINGANDGTWRFIKHLRMTVAGQPTQQRLIALARMRIVGSRWTKRDITGVNTGLLSDQPGLGTAEVRVGPVSALVDPTYRIPITANANAQDPNTRIGGNGLEINEKSLRVAYDDLAPNDRAEVYYRYAQQARSFMSYRSLRLWALPKRGNWGTPDGERFVVKIGSDPRNYYMYQTTLRPAYGDAIERASWLPEVVIDFEEWFALKVESERRLIERPPTAGGQDTIWSADSTYALVLEDRARAPNLQQVREISFAVYNGSSMTTDGEVWIDDMRLTGATRAAGRAGAITLDMNAGDFINGSISYAQQDDVFQQLNETPSYLAAGDVSFNADAHLDRLMPSSWGIDLPLSLTHSRSGQDPTFLANTDVLAGNLGTLRETGSGNTRVGVRLSKRTPTANPWLSLLVDGSSLRFGYSTAANRQITSRTEAGSLDAGVSYSHPVLNKSIGVLPAFARKALRAIVPGKIENSDAFKRMTETRFRFTPSTVSFSSGYNDQMSRSYNFNTILESPEDSLIRAIESPRQGLQNDVSISLRPFNPLTASLGMSSRRDLLSAERATQDARVRQAIENARGTLGGVDVGWETTRNLNTSIGYEPDIASWLRLGYTYTNLYDTDRNPSFLSEAGAGPDSANATMQRRFQSGRVETRRVQVRPADGLTAALGAAPKGVRGLSRAVRATVGRFDVLEFTWTNGLSSQFERESILPGIAYQLGLGGLESFKIIGADTAARALRTGDFTTTAGFAITKSMRFDLRYRNTDRDGFDLRGGQRLQNERQWPSVKLTVRNTPLPESWKKFVTNVNFEAGADRVLTNNLIGVSALQNRQAERIEIPVGTTITFPKAVNLTYAGKQTIGTNKEPTGRRETVTGYHRFALTSILPAPRFLSAKLDDPVQASLSLTQTTTNQCGSSTLIGIGAALCSKQIETTTRQGRFQMDTGLQDMRVGIALDYNARQNYVGTQTGTSQFMLSLTGQFNLNAGRDMSELGGIR